MGRKLSNKLTKITHIRPIHTEDGNTSPYQAVEFRYVDSKENSYKAVVNFGLIIDIYERWAKYCYKPINKQTIEEKIRKGFKKAMREFNKRKDKDINIIALAAKK